MDEALFRIQGLDGLVHDARWKIWNAPGWIGIYVSVTDRHDVDDLAVSLHLAMTRASVVSDHLEIRPPMIPADDAFNTGCWFVVESPSGYEDLPEVDALTTVLRQVVAGSAGSHDVVLAAKISPGLADKADLVALLGLRDIDVPIAAANARLLAEANARPLHLLRPLLRPVPPEDAHLIGASDPRYFNLIEPFRNLRELVRQAAPAAWGDTSDLLYEVRRIRSALEGATLEDVAESILTTALGEGQAKWVEPMRLRFGLEGDKLWTLDEVGGILGMTRERARQVQSKVVAPLEPIWAPSADAAIRIIEHATPCTPSELADAFAASGVSTKAQWSAEPLRSVLALTGRLSDIQEAEGLLGRPEQLRGLNKILPAARAVSNMSGMGDVVGVLLRLADAGVAQDITTVTRMLRKADDVHWLDHNRFWVEHPTGRNRLVNVSMRILSVSQPQTLEDMHGGVDRHFRWRSSIGGPRLSGVEAPDTEVLLQFYRSHPAFRVTVGGKVVATVTPDINDLGAEKLAMVGVFLAQATGVLDRNRVMQACQEVGMKSSTVSIFLTYGECFKSYGPNVWGLRGIDVTPEIVDQTKRAARVSSLAYDRRKASGLTPSGRPWMATKITPTILYSGVISDWARGRLDGLSLDLIDLVDGEWAGTSKFTGAFNYGYNVILRKYAAKVGDVIRVLADPRASVCHVEIGGEELLSEPFDL